jgi:hypothetical protein
MAGGRMPERGNKGRSAVPSAFAIKSCACAGVASELNLMICCAWAVMEYEAINAGRKTEAAVFKAAPSVKNVSSAVFVMAMEP